ncbi:MAG TPA: ATPase domain-containing protein [Candidatus Baltobacteraceae bacterium]|nr:ATPase domain-containing protein [Candidatus Baltobacteraceae bacterium]
MKLNGVQQRRMTTGIAGFDEVLHGGYVAGRTYLLTGPPGGGKTTFGWHFLVAGAQAGEKAMFVTFGESEHELRANARESGFDTSGVDLCDLSPSSDLFEKIRSYDIFSAAEVELEPTTQRIIEAVQRVKPQRIFIDSMTALRYLAKDAPEFRRQTLSFLRYLLKTGSTIVMTSEASLESPDDDLRFLSDGVIELDPDNRRRTLKVTKLRGSDYEGGMHTLRLTSHGAVVYPRLVPRQHMVEFEPELLSWGIPKLDQLTHGGLERGTISLITGPSGIGKTTVGMQFVKEAAQRGERSAAYTFDEPRGTLLRRCEAINTPVTQMIQNGTLDVTYVEALQYSADEFANLVRSDIERKGTRVVMIDSISGYKLAVRGEDLNERLHALCRYLQNVGVTVLLINEVRDFMSFRITEVDASYLADNVIYMRYAEHQNDDRTEIGRVIGVLKKRLSDFESCIYNFALTSKGIAIGEPVRDYSGLFGVLQSVQSSEQ